MSVSRPAIAPVLAYLAVCVTARCDFRRIHAGSLEEGFEKEHMSPLLIEGTTWNSANASRDAFRRVFEHIPVQLTRNIEFQSRSGTKPEAVNTTFGAWVETLSEEDSIPFVFEFCNGALCQKIESSFGIPEYLKKSCMILYINAGKTSNGVAFHQHWQTWGHLLAGKKMWYVSPPGNTPSRPFRYENENQLMKDGFQVCEQNEGEIVFLPKDWWHATFNKADWNLAIGGQGGIGIGEYDAARKLDETKLKAMSKEEMQSVLRIAVENGQHEAVETLLSAGATVEENWSKVHGAAASGGNPTILELLSKHGLLLDAKDSSGSTFGHHNPSKNILEFLLQRGVNLSTPDGGGVTVAHEAAMRGHIGSIQLLKEAGVSLSEPCSNGATPAHFAAADGHVGVLRELIKSGVDMSRLDYAGGTLAHHAASQGHVAALRFLLDEKLPSDPDVSGRTLMHEAAATGFPAVLDELHQRGHDAKAEDFSGRSVAQNAAEGGHIEVLRQLRRWGVDLKHIDRELVGQEVLEFLQSSEL